MKDMIMDTEAATQLVGKVDSGRSDRRSEEWTGDPAGDRMDSQYEAWPVNKSEAYVYTTDSQIHRELRQLNRKFATYSDSRGRVFAWQHLAPKGALAVLQSRWSKTNALKNMVVTEVDSPDLGQDERSHAGYSLWTRPPRVAKLEDITTTIPN